MPPQELRVPLQVQTPFLHHRLGSFPFPAPHPPVHRFEPQPVLVVSEALDPIGVPFGKQLGVPLTGRQPVLPMGLFNLLAEFF